MQNCIVVAVQQNHHHTEMESSHGSSESAPGCIPFTSNCDDDQLGTVTTDTVDFDTAATTSTSPRVDITRVATEHLLKLKQRPGVTESLIKEVVEMNQALVRGVIMNATSDIQELESTDPAIIVSKLSEHANSLDCLNTSYSINARMKLNFPTCVSCWINEYTLCATIFLPIGSN